MLEEVEVPQPLDLGVVDLVVARGLGVSKAAARHEIDVDGQSPLPSIEVHPLNEPGRSDPKGCCKQLVGHHPSTRQLANPSSQGGRAAASTVAALSLWICGRRADTAEEGPSDRPPPTTPQAQQQQQEGCLSMNFTHSIFKRGRKKHSLALRIPSGK